MTGQLEEICRYYKENCKLKREIKTLNDFIKFEKNKEENLNQCGELIKEGKY